MRTIADFNDKWLFCLDDREEYKEINYDDSSWRCIRLPHDWSIENELDKNSPTGGGGGYVVAGTAYYRKHFYIENIDAADRFTLYFEGVFMNSTVFVNGERVGGHENGYSSFSVDITGKINQGENLVAVKVDNKRQPNSRWYTGSGIYRDVYLIKTGSVHIDTWGVRCHTNGIFKDLGVASLQINAFVSNESAEEVDATVKHRLLDHEGNTVSVSGTILYLQPGESGKCSVRPDISNPVLWTDEAPYLYTMETTVSVKGREVDKVVNRIGIRTATFDADRGFLLNGEAVKIKGMCLHHDCGIVGSAGYRNVWERRLKLLKDMGCNGIRCSHNIPAPHFLDLCDEMGFLVMDEAFDEWSLGKNKNDNYYSENYSYGINQSFYKNAKTDLETMLRRDYNHPSVILWSIGNEIPEQSSIEGVEILKFLRDICHHEDCSRMVTSACDNIQSIEKWRTLRAFENELDVVGYNYVGRWRNRAETFYEEDRALYPSRRMIGSENPSVGGVRGEYSQDGPRSYVKATLCHEALWRYTLSHDFVAGDFLWTGIDYLGETRWPLRGAAFGPIDTAGFKKDSYYYFRSIWNSNDITLHILPHWNHAGKEGEFMQVVCYTNCDEAALYINDRLVGRRGYKPNRTGAKNAWNEGFDFTSTTNDLHLLWDVPYEKGTLKVEGYKNGELVAVECVETTGETAGLKLTPDEGGYHVNRPIHIEIDAVDEQGRCVPDENMEIKCEIEGKARLMGMDAGNLGDLSLFGLNTRKMHAGKLLAMIIAEEPGVVIVRFSGKNVEKTIELVVD